MDDELFRSKSDIEATNINLHANMIVSKSINLQNTAEICSRFAHAYFSILRKTVPLPLK